MDQTVVDTVTLGGAAAMDMSIWGLFMTADWIVKAVMIILIGASIWSWAIIVDKSLKMRRLSKAAAQFEESFWSGGSLEDLYDRIGGQPGDPMTGVFTAAMREWRRSAAKGLTTKGSDIRASLRQRIEQVMQLSISRELDRLEKHMTFLASVGSVAPFVGLFGTVWGIMNSFQSIAATKNTSLAVVAPGIAEALLATIIGLAAAIPAVIGYNWANNRLKAFNDQASNFSLEFLARAKKDLT